MASLPPGSLSRKSSGVARDPSGRGVDIVNRSGPGLGPTAAGLRMFPTLPRIPRLGIPFESHLGHGITPRQRGFLL